MLLRPAVNCALLVALSLSAVAANAGAQPAVRTRSFPHFPSLCHRADFRLRGRPVRAAVCRDGQTGNEPGLVVLYGCGGFGGLDYRLATDYARAGYATMYLDTFALTPPPGRRGFCGVRPPGDVRGVWRETVLAAARLLAGHKGVDPRRVGLLGWSLGADVALDAARATGAPIAAVVAYSPDAFPPVATRGVQYPPTIVLLSDRGDSRSIPGARAFRGRLSRQAVPVQVYVYAGGSHYWQGRQGRDGFARATAFLRRVL